MSRAHVFKLVAGLFLCALAPTLFATLPGMVDYPDHLARIALLARAGGADANPYYFAAWAPLPNVALDALATPLARWIGPAAAVMLFYAAAQALVLSGAAALEIAVKGAAQLHPLIAAGCLFNAAFALGFLNFEFGVGLALWALAGWAALGPERLGARAALALMAEPALYFSHLFALGAFGFVAGLIIFARVLTRRRTLPGAALDFAILAAPALALELLLDPGGATGGARWFFEGKIATILLCFNGADAMLARADALIALVAVAALAAARRVSLAREGVVVALGLAALYAALPSTWRGGALVDLRALVVAMFVMPAYLDVRFPGRRAALLASMAALAFVALNIGAVALHWRALAPDQAAMIASFAKLPARAKVLVAYTGEGEFPEPLRHVATLAAGEGDAFVADLFAYRGQQPLAAAPGVADLVIPEQMDMPTPKTLRDALRDPAAARPYVRDWRKRFDALYVVGPRAANPAPGALIPLASGERFDLYRIVR